MRTQSLLVVLLAWLVAPPVSAEIKPLKDWRQMRSANFDLMGDVGEGDLRRVAGRLEQFRAAVGRLLPKASVTTATPTTVLVFRSHRNYQPFKPVYNDKVNEHVARAPRRRSRPGHVQAFSRRRQPRRRGGAVEFMPAPSVPQ
jgi:hypothetical protein